MYKLSLTLICLLTINLLAVTVHAETTDKTNCPETLNHTLRVLDSEDEINLCEAYHEKVVLIVNTASHCGFTPQFSVAVQVPTTTNGF